MKLIDADKLIEELNKNSIFRTVTNAQDKSVIEIIDEQPTAFDVDDVTEKICEEIRICNAKLYDNSNTVNMLAICERRQALREVLRLIDKDVMV